jgi:hypothetical protein
MMAADNDTRLANQNRLRELKRAHGSEIRLFCAHDPKELELFPSVAVEPVTIATAPPQPPQHA